MLLLGLPFAIHVVMCSTSRRKLQSEEVLSNAIAILFQTLNVGDVFLT